MIDESKDLKTLIMEASLPLLMMLAMLLRLANLGGALLWYDETFTAWISRLPWGAMVQATAGDMHPPLYYAITWLFTMANGGMLPAIGLRFPSLIFSMLAIPVSMRLARDLFLSKTARYILLVFMAVMPFQLFFAQEARMYALLQLEFLCLLVAAREERPAWICLAATAMLWTHNYALIYLPFAFILPAIMPGRLLWRKVFTLENILPYLSAGLAWLPWVFTMLGQADAIRGAYWIDTPTPGNIINTVYQLFISVSLSGLMVPIAQAIILGAVTWSIYASIKNFYWWRTLPLLTWAFGPLLLAILISLAFQPVLLWRGLIGCAPLLYMLLAQAIADLPPARVAIASAILAPLLVAGVVGYYSYVPKIKAGSVAEAPQQIRAQLQPGDQVVHLSINTALRWMYYAPDLRQVLLTGCPFAPSDLTGATLKAAGIPTLDKDAPLPAGRLWLVVGLSQVSTPCELETAQKLVANAKQVAVYTQAETAFYAIYLRDPAAPAKSTITGYDVTHQAWNEIKSKGEGYMFQNGVTGLGMVLVWIFRPRNKFKPLVETLYIRGALMMEYLCLAYAIWRTYV